MGIVTDRFWYFRLQNKIQKPWSRTGTSPHQGHWSLNQSSSKTRPQKHPRNWTGSWSCGYIVRGINFTRVERSYLDCTISFCEGSSTLTETIPCRSPPSIKPTICWAKATKKTMFTNLRCSNRHTFLGTSLWYQSLSSGYYKRQSLEGAYIKTSQLTTEHYRVIWMFLIRFHQLLLLWYGATNLRLIT